MREVAVGLALEEIYEVENENMNYNFMMPRELCRNCNLNYFEFLFKTWVRASKLQMSQFNHLPELLGAERKRATKASSVQSF